MMIFKKINFFTLFVLVGFLLAGLASVEAGTATNQRTGTSYPNLQDAIDAATSDDTLSLVGTFTGSFVINNKSLTLEGPTVDLYATLDGNGVGRVLEIIGNQKDHSLYSINLSKLTIQNGSATDASSNRGNGGGILSVYVNLNIFNLSLQNNKATSSGGGIAGLYSNLKIEDSEIQSCQAATGGGINHLNSVSEIINSNISSNTANQGGGGGILSNGSTVIITGTLLEKNSSISLFGVGGGICNSTNSTLNVNTSQISKNGADSNGGGLYNESVGTQVILVASLITENVAGLQGGGIYNRGKSEQLIYADEEVVANIPDDVFQK